MLYYLFYILAGLGAGCVTGLAGLSAAVVITPILVSLCGCRHRCLICLCAGQPAVRLYILQK